MGLGSGSFGHPRHGHRCWPRSDSTGPEAPGPMPAPPQARRRRQSGSACASLRGHFPPGEFWTLLERDSACDSDRQRRTAGAAEARLLAVELVAPVAQLPGGALLAAMGAEVIARTEGVSAVPATGGFLLERRAARPTEHAVVTVLHPAGAAHLRAHKLLAATAAEQILVTVHPTTGTTEHGGPPRNVLAKSVPLQE